MLCFGFLFLAVAVYPQCGDGFLIDPDPATQTRFWQELMVHEPAWFASNQARQIAETILIYQRASGGWPKNVDVIRPLSAAKKRELSENPNEPLSTIDNGATYTQMHFLARVYQAKGDPRCVLAFLKGLDYLLEAQYANGGWPQYYPVRNGYYSHITFNDEAMIGVMCLLRDVAEDRELYGFVDEDRRLRARQADKKGLDCILKTQIRVEDRLTAWCAQYDAKTLKPARGRTYELPSLSGKETVGIVRFLMGIPAPSEEIRQAVQGAVAWLDRVKIQGIRVVRRSGAGGRGFDKVVVSDPDAPTLWARFYSIESGVPFFSDRDGKEYHDLSEISEERRNAYGWLGTWPQHLLEADYPEWQKRWAPDTNVLHRGDG